MKKKYFFAALTLCAALRAAAQLEETEPTPQEQLQQNVETLDEAVKKLRKLKVSGYIQTQYQYANYEADGSNYKLANGANDFEKRDKEFFSRVGIRRGRIKFTYTEGIVEGVFQPDITDKGVAFKDVYLNVKDPWIGTNALKAGVFDRPFGYEIAYSSSRRESPERARIVQSLFPDERDLGAMLTLQPAKTSAWNILKLDAGLFAGNGIRPETDSRMDFIGRLSAAKQFGSSIQVGAGVSAYLGGVLQTDTSLFVMKDKEWVLDSKDADNLGKYLPRQYFGVDLQIAAITAIGQTQLRAEYIFGKHPGTKGGAYDFKFAAASDRIAGIPKGNVYMRDLAGGYIIFTQDLWRLPLTAVFKYDFYDPNTKVSGNDVSNAGDIMRYNIGVGLLWNINAVLRLTCYYDFVNNEKTASDKIDFNRNRKDNVFTLRLQYKF